MSYCLFLDDIRHPYDAFPYTKDTKYLQLKWIVVRSFKDFVEVIEKSGLPSVVSFDHDLALEHYGKSDDPWSVQDQIDYFTYNEKTGYDCAKWLCDYCYDNKVKFPQYLVHSFNQVGSANIRHYIRNFLKHNPEVA